MLAACGAVAAVIQWLQARELLEIAEERNPH